MICCLTLSGPIPFPVLFPFPLPPSEGVAELARGTLLGPAAASSHGHRRFLSSDEASKNPESFVCPSSFFDLEENGARRAFEVSDSTVEVLLADVLAASVFLGSTLGSDGILTTCVAAGGSEVVGRLQELVRSAPLLGMDGNLKG